MNTQLDSDSYVGRIFNLSALAKVSSLRLCRQIKNLSYIAVALSALLLSISNSHSEEVQAHGVNFEKWVRDTFFNGYEGDYTQKWDISAAANTHRGTPKQGIPISVKLVKYGSPIGLGDIIRQRELHDEFLMIVGFWQQKTDTEKWIVEMACLHITPDQWNAVWGDLSVEKLKQLDKLVKDMSTDYKEVRVQAQDWKKQVLPGLNCKMVVNPKIGSTTQRRVQCSMPFKLFWQMAGREPVPEAKRSLFGTAFPNPMYSKPRVFKIKPEVKKAE